MFNEIKDEGKSVLVNNFIWILGGFLCPPKNAKDNLNSVLYAAIGGLMSTEEDVSWYKHCRQVNETIIGTKGVLEISGNGNAIIKRHNGDILFQYNQRGDESPYQIEHNDPNDANKIRF